MSLYCVTNVRNSINRISINISIMKQSMFMLYVLITKVLLIEENTTV